LKKILAIDPSWESTGLCFFDAVEKKIISESFSPLKNVTGVSGKILKKQSKDHFSFYCEIKGIILKNEIDTIIINDMFSVNHNTLKALFELVGIVKLIANQTSCGVVTFFESQIRKQMTGYGGSDRAKSKNLSLNFAKNREMSCGNDDESDAFMLYTYFHEKGGLKIEK
jgi:Holliday junction resolvasome RuvABC endonuclease subunit